jgi:hypothetical protein
MEMVFLVQLKICVTCEYKAVFFKLQIYLSGLITMLYGFLAIIIKTSFYTAINQLYKYYLQKLNRLLFVHNYTKLITQYIIIFDALHHKRDENH